MDGADARETVAYCNALTAAMRVPVGPYPEYRRAIRAAAAPQRPPDAELKVGILGGRMLEMLCRTDAASRLARVALAVAEVRAKTGDFPASLDELKPMLADGVPLDPYTDAPFVYGKTATGVRIASAGRLAEDPPLADSELRERCLVWELKR
jgi:hypothetical protein